jgi:hypothetical protein
MTAILLKNIDFQGASANNGMMVLGYPAMTAFNGLSHHVLRSYRKMFGDATAKLLRFHVVHHDGSLRKHGFRVTNKRSVNIGRRVERGDRASMNFTPQMQPGAQVDFRASIVIDASLDSTIAARVMAAPELRFILSPAALGGRAVQDGASGVAILDNVETALADVSSGWLVLDRTAELFAGNAKDPLDRMIDLLDAETDPAKIERRRLLPTTVGFRAISSGAHRAGSRNLEATHYFAEPILGLAEFLRPYAARNEFKEEWIDRSAWKPVIDRSAGNFVIGSPGYQAGSASPKQYS